MIPGLRRPPFEVGSPFGQHLRRAAGDDLGHPPGFGLEHEEDVRPEGLNQGFGRLGTDPSVGVRQIAHDCPLIGGQTEAANTGAGSDQGTILRSTRLAHDLPFKEHRALSFSSTPGASSGPQSPSEAGTPTRRGSLCCRRR